MILSRKTLAKVPTGGEPVSPPDGTFELPEKVLQFGTGVLLRGLPDYFIDQANRKGIFNGRVVVVKSTGSGDTGAFERQDGLYTLCVRGISNGKEVKENRIISAISRVLSAQRNWKEILQCAANPEMQLVISNTTEVGITLFADDDLKASPPASFPGKLLAFLWQRFHIFGNNPSKGMVIIPTELIPGNGERLKDTVHELAVRNRLGADFMDWLDSANYFCNSLVDRIVPGNLPEEERRITVEKLGYEDRLMISAEPYRLWAIESGVERVRQVLSFREADPGVILAPDIGLFRELKLRLLNGTHTFACGLALLKGFDTVKAAMEDPIMENYIRELMTGEIAPAITSETLTAEAANSFSQKVIDRFRNPFIEHQWVSIALQYTSKMKMRNLPALLAYYKRFSRIPEKMVLGFAAHLLFMRCTRSDDGKYYGRVKGISYPITDDHAGYYAAQWDKAGDNPAALVRAVLSDRQLWGTPPGDLPGFPEAVIRHLQSLDNSGID